MDLPFELWQLIANSLRLWEQMYMNQLNCNFHRNIKYTEIVKPSIVYHYLQEKYKRLYGDKVVLIKTISNSIYRVCDARDFAVMDDIERIIIRLLPKKRSLDSVD